MYVNVQETLQKQNNIEYIAGPSLLFTEASQFYEYNNKA